MMLLVNPRSRSIGSSNKRLLTKRTRESEVRSPRTASGQELFDQIVKTKSPGDRVRNGSETTSVDLREVRRGAAQRPFRRRASERGLSVVVGLRPKLGSYFRPVPWRKKKAPPLPAPECPAMRMTRPCEPCSAHGREAAAVYSLYSGDPDRQASASTAQRSEKTLVLFRQFVSVPAPGLGQRPAPVFGLELRIVPQSLDHGHPGSHCLGGRHDAASWRAPVEDREHEPGIAQGLG
jgi:hypothetical protein